MRHLLGRVFGRRARAFRTLGGGLADVHESTLDVRSAVGRLEEAIGAGHGRVGGLTAQLAEIQQRLDELERRSEADRTRAGAAIAEVSEALAAASATIGLRLQHLGEQVNIVRADEAGHRRRLHALRASQEYEAAYSEEAPLVSVIIPTLDRVTELRDRSLPSVFAQTHQNIEVIVIGDASPPAMEQMIEGLGDPRVRYINLPFRGPYPEEPGDLWFVKGVQGFNAGLEAARGRWISPFADDDVLRPDAIEQTLREARARRLELCYGRIVGHMWNGTTEEIGAFPPRLGGQGLQGSVLHAGLRYVHQELGDAAFGVPSDWWFTYRLMRIGVRIGRIDHVVADWFQTPHPDYVDHPDRVVEP